MRVKKEDLTRVGVVAKEEICYPLSYDRSDHYICGARRLDLSGTSGQAQGAEEL